MSLLPVWSLASENCVLLTWRRPKSLSLSHSPGIFLTKSPVGWARRKVNYRQVFYFYFQRIKRELAWKFVLKRVYPTPPLDILKYFWVTCTNSYFKSCENSVHCQLCINHWAVPVSNRTFLIICILSFLSLHQKSISTIITLLLMHQTQFVKFGKHSHFLDTCINCNGAWGVGGDSFFGHLH